MATTRAHTKAMVVMLPHYHCLSSASGELCVYSCDNSSVRCPCRLKSSELERGRARARLSAFRDKIFELERELSVLRERDEDIKTASEKIEVLRLSNSRKDAMVKSQKENLERMQVELLSFKEIAASKESDLEKHNRHVLSTVYMSTRIKC